LDSHRANARTWKDGYRTPSPRLGSERHLSLSSIPQRATTTVSAPESEILVPLRQLDGKQIPFSLSEDCDSAGAEASGTKSERGNHSPRRNALWNICVRRLPFTRPRRQRRLGSRRRGSRSQ